MNDEEIIRLEAQEFYQQDIVMSRSDLASDHIHDIRHRLSDFYSSENKAIFLDEIEILISKELQKHRDNAHGGLPGKNCSQEKTPMKLQFYIKQELGTLPIIPHQKNISNPEQTRDKVFISYSHVDKEYLTDIQRHFKPFLKHIKFWDDSQIKPGTIWKEQIKKAIEETKVAILLVSTDFLGSDFIATEEIPPLLKAAEENGALILIVILRPCLFEEFNNINIYQAMNPPSNPISKMDSNEKEEFYVNLVRQTKNALANEL